MNQPLVGLNMPEESSDVSCAIPSSNRNAALIRGADIIIASAALLLVLPLLLALGLLVLILDGYPVTYAQPRIGLNGTSFRCRKFRTMVVDADKRLHAILADDPFKRACWERDQKLFDDPRITRLGNILRASSLDELPQLWNVLRGDMSLVGPRPIVSSEVPRYGRYFADYKSVRPGITGLWQVSGRNDVSYRRRVALDVAYSRSATLSLYLRVLLLTVPAVCMRRGSY